MQGVNDAGAATGGNAGDGLRVLQIGIHPRGVIEEENFEQFG